MKIAIKGNELRGKEVIQILESLGGVNVCPLEGNSADSYYYIDYDCNNAIYCHDLKYVNKYCKKYTLEEFEKEFPFKAGDLCMYYSPICGEMVLKILGLFLKSDSIVYEVDSKYSTRVHSGIYKERHLLKPHKEMQEERNITLTLNKAKEWYNKGGDLKQVALQAFSEKELNLLPKSWEEFCKQGNPIASWRYNIPIKYEALFKLEQLRDCWRQGWKPTTYDTGYLIVYYPNNYVVTAFNFIGFLSFPTEEMAKEFLECFKDLIEKAGDLI